MADTLSLLFELDADGKPAVAEFKRVRAAFASELAALRKSVVQSFTLPPIKLPTVAATGGRGGQSQVDAQVKDFRRIEAEAAKSAKAQEREQQRLNAAVESLQRQRTAAMVRAFNEEQRAAIASAKAQERAVAASFKAQERAAANAVKAQQQAARDAASRLARTPQSDQQVRDFRRIEAERQKAAKASEVASAKSARAQEAEQRRLNSSVQSLQRQRSAAFIAGFKAEERAAVASLRVQERAAQQASRSIANAFRSIGPGLQSVGRTLTVGITAPLLALGLASLKSAKDIDANVNTLKALTGSAEAAEARLAQLIKVSRQTPGLTTNLALTLDAQLRTAQVTQEAIDRVLPAIGRLNAVAKLEDPQRFTQNLVQLITTQFQTRDLRELVRASPVAGQIVRELFNVDSPINGKAIRESAKKLGLTSVDAFFTAFAEAAARNQGLRNVTESIGTRFDKMVDRVKLALRPLGLAILNAIEPFVEPVARLVERIGDAFNSLSPPIKTAIIVIAGLAAAAGPVLFALGSMVTGLAGVAKAVAAVTAVISLIGFPELLLVIGGLVVVIGEWAAILGVLGLAWKNNFLGIRDLVASAATAVLQAFDQVRTVVNEVAQQILPTLQSITTKVLAAITFLWEQFGRKILEVIRPAFAIVVSIITGFVRQLGNFIDLALKLIDGDWRGAWRAFSRIVIAAIEGLPVLLARLQALLTTAFVKLFQTTNALAIQIAIAAERLAVSFVASLAAKLINEAGQVRDALTEMFLRAALSVNPTTVVAVIVGRIAAAMKKAAAEGITVPVTAAVQNVGVDVGLENFPKKKPPSEEDTKGADAAARRRIRLLEIEADKVRTLTDAQLAREQIQFDERKKSLKEWTNDQIVAAHEVLTAQLAIFKQERDEALKIRNKSARDLAFAEVGQREFEAQQTFTTKVAQLEANRRKEELAAAKAHREALLDVQDEGDKKQLELIDSYVDRYLISFKEAEKRRLKIEEDGRERRGKELQIQLTEAGDNVEQQQRVKDAIAKLDAESATAREDAENRKRRAIEATQEAENSYYATLREITLNTTRIIRDAIDIELSRLVRKFGDRRRFRLEALRLEREANEEEHQERLRAIEQQRRDEEKELKGVEDREEKLLELRRRFALLEKAENERRAAEREREADDERDVRDPFSNLRKRFAEFQFDIQNVKDSILDSLQSISEQVGSSISAMADALRQGIVAWILYGDSLGKALKQALAQQLATLAAEFAIQALKHAAYALGSLAFGDFAGAAKHAAAAAAFTAAAAATGIAGRALAKSSGLYKPSTSAGTASAAVGGGAEAQNRQFNYGGQGPIESSSQSVREGSAASAIMGLADEVKKVRQENALLTAQLQGTLSRINSMPAGQVVTIGAPDAQQAIGVAVIGHSNSSGDFNEAMGRNLGFGR